MVSLLEKKIFIIYVFRGWNEKREAKECFVKSFASHTKKEHLEHNKIIYFLNRILVLFTNDWTQHEIAHEKRIPRNRLWAWESFDSYTKSLKMTWSENGHGIFKNFHHQFMSSIKVSAIQFYFCATINLLVLVTKYEKFFLVINDAVARGGRSRI